MEHQTLPEGRPNKHQNPFEAACKLAINKAVPLALFRIGRASKAQLLIDLGKDQPVQEKTPQFVFTPFSENTVQQRISIRADLLLNSEDTREEDLQTIEASIPFKKAIYRSQGKPYIVNKKRYADLLNATIDQLKSKETELQKIIISRVDWLEKEKECHPYDIFDQLCSMYPTAHVSLVFHPEAGMWIGASPETLVSGEGKNYRTVALAGTRKSLGDVVWREKEIEEQAFVVEGIRQSLKEVGVGEIKEEGPYTRYAGQVAHLKTEFSFQFEGDIHTLLNKLHPTPAICGTPTVLAKALIEEIEDHNRSYYTGFQGIFNLEGKTHAWVNLRNMQVHPDGYAIYVGGGITAASNVDEEWEETCLKAQTMRQAVQDVQEKLQETKNSDSASYISDKRTVQSLLNVLKAKGIRRVVLSPGSRNAPLMLSLEQDPWFEKYVIVDERSAAFFAMGMAQQTRQATMLVCTSGSASLNYAPAIVEAYYQKIPLLVVTADRPIEWIDRGEGQSIRQKDIYTNYIRASYELVQDTSDPDLLWHNELLINRAIEETNYPVAGPVHINFPLRENLYGKSDLPNPQAKLVSTLPVVKHLEESTFARLCEQLRNSPKVLILTGLLNPNEELEAALGAISKHLNFLVMTETTSNLQHPNFISAIDRTINSFSPDDEADFKPDVLITIGTHLVSKMVKRMLRRQRPAAHWHVSESELYLDTFQSLTLNIPIPPSRFFNALVEANIVCESDYRSFWQQRFLEIRNHHLDYIESAPFSDLKAMGQILQHLPEGSDLQMGNSSVVRYILLHGPQPSINYFGNRGTSGIDGCTSTAVGAAWITRRPTTLISGDLAFLYDSNALWNSYLAPNLKLILINNGGGGIFRIINGPSDTEALEQYFEAHHQLNASSLADMFGLPYKMASDGASLEEGLGWLYGQQGTALLEVATPREVNDQELKQYFAYLKEKVRVMGKVQK